MSELNRPITINAAQADLRQFLDERGWYPSDTEGRYYTTVHMMEELGELARVITHLESRRAEVQITRQQQVLQREELEIELGDVFCHVLKLAEAYGVSVEDCFVRTMNKNRKKYPLEKFEGMGFDKGQNAPVTFEDQDI
ncbi:MAG TPA: MazG-like family protein [Chloroflexia bacterium]|nr:MazG-like family protein [Chloroflexia bacterium]